jgi:hypothetical protein
MGMSTNLITLASFETGPAPEELVPLLVPVASFGAIVAVVAIVLFFRYRTQRLRHEMYRVFLEKGEPIPPELLGRRASQNGDLRRGLVLLGGGVGLTLAILLAHQPEAAGFGLIPALIGVGFLVVWKIELRSGVEAVHE